VLLVVVVFVMFVSLGGNNRSGKYNESNQRKNQTTYLHDAPLKNYPESPNRAPVVDQA
jgi:hypothetical protein